MKLIKLSRYNNAKYINPLKKTTIKRFIQIILFILISRFEVK